MKWFSQIVVLASVMCLLVPFFGMERASSDVLSASAAAADTPVVVGVAPNSAPVMFIENVGQFPDGARFQVRGANNTLWLADDALWITVFEPESNGAEAQGNDAPLHHQTSGPLS